MRVQEKFYDHLGLLLVRGSSSEYGACYRQKQIDHSARDRFQRTGQYLVPYRREGTNNEVHLAVVW